MGPLEEHHLDARLDVLDAHGGDDEGDEPRILRQLVVSRRRGGGGCCCCCCRRGRRRGLVVPRHVGRASKRMDGRGDGWMGCSCSGDPWLVEWEGGGRLRLSQRRMFTTKHHHSSPPRSFVAGVASGRFSSLHRRDSQQRSNAVALALTLTLHIAATTHTQRTLQASFDSHAPPIHTHTGHRPSQCKLVPPVASPSRLLSALFTVESAPVPHARHALEGSYLDHVAAKAHHQGVYVGMIEVAGQRRRSAWFTDTKHTSRPLHTRSTPASHRPYRLASPAHPSTQHRRRSG